MFILRVFLQMPVSSLFLKSCSNLIGGTKTVTVETGATVNVPLFVNQDDTIVIQTKDGSYISRG